MMKKLAIIGASYLQLPLINKAIDLGVETHVFAWEDGAVGKDICEYFYPISIIEKDQILQKCKEIGIDGITSISSDLAMNAVNYVAEKLNLVGNGVECNLKSTNKGVMRSEFKKNKLPIPKFISLNNDCFDVDWTDYSFPMIVKPSDRSGSRGVTKVYTEKEMEVAIERAFAESFNKKVVVEEFIDGKEISIECISINGEHYFLAATDKVTTGEPYFVEIEQHQPSLFPKEIINKAKDLVFKALNVLGIKNGASHSELIITSDNKIYIVEIGSRMGGDNIGAELVKNSTGFDYVKAVIEIALGLKPQVNLICQNFSGIFYITPKSGRIESVTIDPTIHEYIANVESILSVGDLVSYPVKESAERAGYILYNSISRPQRKELTLALQYKIK